MTGRRQGVRHCRAISLVEILVVLAVVATLAVLAVPAFKHWKYSANRAESVGVIHQIGTALAQYAAENNALPSPLWSYQSPGYKTSPTSLIYHLAPYLQGDGTNKDGEFLPGYVPAFLKQWYLTKRPSRPSIYMLHTIASLEDGTEFYLWGYPASGSDGPISPVNWAVACGSLPLSQTVALSDWTTADQVTPSQKSHQLPAPYELQNYKTRLFLDWHAETAKFD